MNVVCQCAAEFVRGDMIQLPIIGNYRLLWYIFHTNIILLIADIEMNASRIYHR